MAFIEKPILDSNASLLERNIE